MQRDDARKVEAWPWTRLASDDRLTWTITEVAQLLVISRATAYEILLGMKGKLERPLVEAFKDVALNR